MTHLILTIGTGTAGKTSNLEAGLRTTLQLISPAAFWLIPSTDEVSTLMADLVREGNPAFRPWSTAAPYQAIANADSLETCRATVREVIRHVRQQLPKGTQLLVNPTSGTKQMSAGATLAALDEGIGKIVFTVGERADGVVITGTERLETFDATAYFAERDLATARDLDQAGAHAAAAALLARYESLGSHAATARCLHEWERQNYAEARRIAAGCAALQPHRHPLEQLAQAAQEPAPPPLILADLLYTSDLLHRRREFDTALTLACRTLELGLRRTLFNETGLHEPYPLPDLLALRITEDIRNRLRTISNDGRTTILNLQTVARILEQLQNPLGSAYFNDRDLQALIRVRNELMHSLRAVTEAESQAAQQRVINLLSPALSLPQPTARPAF